MNNMSFNISKFEAISYKGRSTTRTNHTYKSQDGGDINPKETVRDLGITIKNDCSFTENIQNMAKKAKARMGWILRTFQTRGQTCMLTLYKSIVLPLVEYCCQLWHPYKAMDTKLLESIQRTFTSKIHNCQVRRLNYWERLKELNLYSLQRRRERYIIIYIWKILNRLVPNILFNGNEAITLQPYNERRGKLCQLTPLTRTTRRLQTIQYTSLWRPLYPRGDI